MKDFKVVAYTGKGDDRKEVGSKVIKVAENLKECVSIVGDEAKVIALFNQQYKTNTRNTLARPAGGSVADKTRFESAKRLVEAGQDWKIVEIASGYTKETYNERLKQG